MDAKEVLQLMRERSMSQPMRDKFDSFMADLSERERFEMLFLIAVENNNAIMHLLQSSGSFSFSKPPATKQ